MGTKGKWLACALCAMMVFALASCSMVSVNEERDNAQVVAEVNGTQITKDKYRTVLQNMLYSYGMTEQDIEEQDDPAMYKQQVLDSLVDQELLYEQAKKDGLADESEAKREEIRKEQQESLDSMKESYKMSAEEAGEADPEAVAEKQYQEYLEAVGLNDMEAYIDDRIKSDAISAMYDKAIESATYTEEEAKTYFDEQVAIQQPLVDKDPTNYSVYEMGNQAYYNPAGSKYVKNLLIGIPDDIQSQISALRQEEKDTEADALLQEELAKIQLAAQKALDRVTTGGEDFDAVIEDVGEDNGMTVDPGKTYGYLVHENANFVEPFKVASLALEKVGDITELVPSDFGYHIIKYIKDGAGAIDFEMVKQDVIDSKLSSLQNEAYTAYVDKLEETASVVTHISRV